MVQSQTSPWGGAAALVHVLDPNGAESGRTFKLSNGESASAITVRAGSVTGERRRKQRSSVLHPSTQSSFCTRQKLQWSNASSLVFIISNISCPPAPIGLHGSAVCSCCNLSVNTQNLSRAAKIMRKRGN